MNTTELMERMARKGVKISHNGTHLQCSPRSAITAEMEEALRVHKQELLGLLESHPTQLPEASTAWHAALSRLEGFPPEAMEALRAARVRWVHDTKQQPCGSV